ncbi:cytochrome c biogenesis CcdA family protein [Sinorhizobium meliloti]|jgi:cytochrome c-type biogenesis protein|uniref:cytochrome c biogenesis CcdA family protein n=1 Tax=Rhizobium meliloti TaxID=382 RepID=UPI002D79D604|nr:cytochrome c biogenesis protein CcdA [Sinorhizobium meliloti]WRQ70595.1 cytochrome c biogenesis protein CcdA [Sinorhizobium meliloti]
MISTLIFATIAGVLSILSPCVLPLVPIVLATAIGKHRYGHLALAAGLAGSFVAIGMFVALLGFGIGLDLDFFRSFGALLMIGLGVVLILPSMQVRFATAAGPIGNWTERRFGGQQGDGWRGQFVVGLLLGTVWSPCVGPTLGAASLMAARGENLTQVFLTMAAFGLGAAAPLLLLGQLSREVLNRWRDRMLGFGKVAKAVFGAVLLVIGIAILTGVDKQLEAALVEASPAWLTSLTTRF